ncbi:Lmo0850 family protein [Siminovitchia sp. 179-K 8D1 HS]|uniref:Lmo0850 family protein n=1 Tax=Siminovitchia sp. 179-K 8D1 HS TaxID=3142385 RepID=UPI0039A3A7AD
MIRCQIPNEVVFLQRDHEQLEKMINSLTEMGVNISKTKSRFELFEVLAETETIPGYTTEYLF